MQERPFNFGLRALLFIGLGVLGCTLDLFTKHLVFSHEQLFPGSEWWLWEGHVGIQKGLNEGALFGLGQGATSVFAAISIVAAAAIPIWLFRFGAAKDLLLTVTLSCIFGGILGNLYDRLGLHGMRWDQFRPERGEEKIHAVRDWILFQWNDQCSWPNFNIADSLLVIGVVVLFVHCWKTPRPNSSSHEN